MKQIYFGTVLGLVATLSFSLNAKDVSLCMGDTTIYFNLRADLLYIESDDDSKETIVENFADSVLFDNFFDGFLIKIDTLKTNIEDVKKISGVWRFANTLEPLGPFGNSGYVYIPGNSIFVVTKRNISEKTALDELKKNGVKVVSSELFSGDWCAVKEDSCSYYLFVYLVSIDAELNDVLEICNRFCKNPYFEYVEPNFFGILGGGDNGVSVTGSKQNAKLAAGLEVRQDARMLRITVHNRGSNRLKVALYDLAGRRRNVSPVHHADGVVSLPLSNIAKGTYVLRVVDGRNKWERRILAK